MGPQEPRISNTDYQQAYCTPEQPWWEELQTDFRKRPDTFDVDRHTQVLVWISAAIDLVLRTVGAILLALFCMPSAFNPFRRTRDQEDATQYKLLAETSDVDRFFKRPSEAVAIQETARSWYHFRPKDGECKTLSFDSPFQPVNERLTARYQKHSRNRKAQAQYWRHHGAPRPTICAIHGFMADAYWANSRFLALRWFYERGYDVLLYTLPFHGHRQGVLSPFSGHGFFAGGVCQLNEAVAQSVYDFRIFMDHLESKGVEQIGVTGISLGGYTSAILAAVEERLAFVIPNVPVVGMADLLVQWVPSSWVTRCLMKLNGLDLRELRHRLAVHNPLTYPPRIPKERLMIIGGAGDRMAPPKHARLLWEHWSECRIHWFPGSHVIHLDQGRYLDEMFAFMQDIGFQWSPGTTNTKGQ